MIGLFRLGLELFWNRAERRFRAGWRLLLHILITATLIVLGAAALEVAIWSGRITPEALMQLRLLHQTSSLILGGLISFFLIDRRRWSELKINRTYLREFWIGCAIGGGSMTWIFFIGLAGHWIQIERAGASGSTSSISIIQSLLLWFGMMILVGISEELFSRGQQLKNLAEGLRSLGVYPSAFIAVVLSSLVFAGLHLANPNVNALSTANIAFAGILLAIARMATGRLALAIGLHTAWNYFQGPVFGFAVSGLPTDGSLFRVQSIGPTWITGGDFGPEAGLLGLIAIFINAAIIIFAFAHFTTHRPRVAYALAATRLVRFESRHRTSVKIEPAIEEPAAVESAVVEPAVVVPTVVESAESNEKLT